MNEAQMELARLYAGSMLELAGRDGAGELLAELDALVALLDARPEVDALLDDPLLGAARREELLERTLRGRASDLLVDSLQVIRRKGRLGLLRSIARAYREAYDEAEGRIPVEVTTAVPLDDRLRERLRAAVSRFTGMSAVLEERVDADLVGGVVLRVGDRKIDTSVAGELERIHDVLVERASREIHRGAEEYVEE